MDEGIHAEPVQGNPSQTPREGPSSGTGHGQTQGEERGRHMIQMAPGILTTCGIQRKGPAPLSLP